MHKRHRYETAVVWTGNLGTGTSDYKSYARDHEIRAAGKPPLLGSSDPAFRGDAARHNPEEMLVASLSACHMLWYLHLCAEASVIVLEYVDRAEGTMVETADGGGRFVEVVLRPRVTLRAGADLTKAGELHDRAHALCFIANSVSFPVRHEPEIVHGG